MSSVLRLKLRCLRNDDVNEFELKAWFSEFEDLEHAFDASSGVVLGHFHHTVSWQVVCPRCNNWDRQLIKLPQGWRANDEVVKTTLSESEECKECINRQRSERRQQRWEAYQNCDDPYERPTLYERWYYSEDE